MKGTKQGQILLVSSLELGLSASQNCWYAQVRSEHELTAATERFYSTVQRAYPRNSNKKDGFVDLQRMGMDIFHHTGAGQPLTVTKPN
jgi:hypothetical protein